VWLVSEDHPPSPPGSPVAGVVVDAGGRRRGSAGGGVTAASSTKRNVAAKPCRCREASVASSTVRPCPEDVTVSALRVPQRTARTSRSESWSWTGELRTATEGPWSSEDGQDVEVGVLVVAVAHRQPVRTRRAVAAAAEHRHNVSLDTKYAIPETFPKPISSISWCGMEKTKH